MRPQLDAFLQRAGLHFQETDWLEEAFRHSSWINEHPQPALQDNERLEYLGDAVLELSVSTLLFREHPELPEGKMTKLRAQLVCEDALARMARHLDLGEALQLGKGEEEMGGRQRSSLLADATEALIGALYLDQGFEAAAAWVIAQIRPLLTEQQEALYKDYKSAYLEYLQSQPGHPQAVFRVLAESGPVHEPSFTVELQVNGSPVSEGHGRSKKLAEQEAARVALSRR